MLIRSLNALKNLIMDKFKGLGVAMVTPFNKEGQVDYNALKNLTEHLISNGVDYLVVMGTTGENPTLSADEQKRILDQVISVNEKRKPIVFGVGGNNTLALAYKLSSMSFDGIDGILSVSPYYNKPNQEGIYQHYMRLADSSGAPLIIYNVPGRTGSLIQADTTLRISEHENIIATKEASGSLDVCMEILRNKSDDFMVISGDDNYTLPYISLGMSGVISVIGNAYPKSFSQMVHYALDGNMENARYLHYKLLPLMNAIFLDGNPGGIKIVLKELGITEEYMRMPLHPVKKEVRKLLQDLVSDFKP